NSDPNPETHCDADPEADLHSHGDVDSNPNPKTHRNADVDADANSNPQNHRNTDAVPQVVNIAHY
ncbi:hypothetical protein KFL_015390010, partial [Klebsormidium nitens]